MNGWPVFCSAYWLVEVRVSGGGSNQLVWFGVLDRWVPAQGRDEVEFLTGRHLDEVSASAADASTVAEAMLAEYTRLPRHCRGT